MLSTPIRLLNLSMGGLWTRLRTALECGWDAILRAAPKQYSHHDTVSYHSINNSFILLLLLMMTWYCGKKTSPIPYRSPSTPYPNGSLYQIETR